MRYIFFSCTGVATWQSQTCHLLSVSPETHTTALQAVNATSHTASCSTFHYLFYYNNMTLTVITSLVSLLWSPFSHCQSFSLIYSSEQPHRLFFPPVASCQPARDDFNLLYEKSIFVPHQCAFAVNFFFFLPPLDRNVCISSSVATE